MKQRVYLTLIVFFSLVSRLFFALKDKTLTYASYFHIRHANYIIEHGVPLFVDPLSYGGRELFFLPFFHYTLALLGKFIPLEWLALVIPSIALSTLPIIIYSISLKITKDSTAAIFGAVIAGFVPALFMPATLTPDILFLPLSAAIVYFFLEREKQIYTYITIFLISSLTTSATSLIIVGYLIYLLLSFAEGKRNKRSEIELITFSLFLYLWTQFLFFKNGLLRNGVSFVWRNTPPQAIATYFPELTIAKSILFLSPLPLIVGLYVTYNGLFQTKNKKTFLLISFVISTILLSWMQLIQPQVALGFLSVIIALLFSIFYKEARVFLKRKTKLGAMYTLFSVGLLVLLLGSLLPASFIVAEQEKKPTTTDIAAFKWLENHIPQESGVVALLEEGHLITYYGNKKNLMDERFDNIANSEERFSDLNNLFTTSFQTQALSLLSKYNIEYIVFSSAAKEKYPPLPYLSKECFEVIYSQETKIYKVRCTISETT